MNSSLRLLFSALLVIHSFQGPARAQETKPKGTQRVELSVDGIAREARVYVPPSAQTVRTPVVFSFHGHNGNASDAARDYGMQREWPEAITVYMQGLNTPGRFIDPEGKETGWQMQPGNQGDRDLEFFDAMLAYLKDNYKVDEKRVYAFGHSGGGYFVYLLWATRSDALASVAPLSSEAAENLPMLKPKPVLLLGGKKDGAVKYEWVRKTMDAVRELNGCSTDGTPWDVHCTRFPSPTGSPVVEYVHPGGHEVPKGAIAAIARFFKEIHPDKSKQTSGNPVFDGSHADPEGVSAQQPGVRFNRAPLKPKPYAALRLGEVRAEGWLRTQLELMADGMSSRLDELYPSVVGPRNGWLGGDGDGWERGPYWIDGLLPLAHLLDDEVLIAKVKPWVEWTLRNQTDDGYLGPVPFASEPSDERGLQRGMRRDWWPKTVTS